MTDDEIRDRPLDYLVALLEAIDVPGVRGPREIPPVELRLLIEGVDAMRKRLPDPAHEFLIDSREAQVWVCTGAQAGPGTNPGEGMSSLYRLGSEATWVPTGHGGGVASLQVTRRTKRIMRALLETALEELDAYDPIDPIVEGGVQRPVRQDGTS